MIKSVLFTSKYHNKLKGKEVYALFKKMANIKNILSSYIYNSKELLFSSEGIKTLKANYKLVKDDTILAWNIQKEHQLLVDLYKNALNKHLKNFKIRIQSKMVIEQHKRNKKLFKILFKSTNLTKFVKYLMYLDLDKDILPQIHNEAVLALYEYYKSKHYFNRIVNLAKSMQKRILDKIKLIQFKNISSLILDHKVNKARIDYDKNNTLYKYWFIFTMKGKEYRLPLQISNNYHNESKKLVAKEFIIYPSLKENKINIVTTYDAENLVFKPFNKVVGMDLNLKNNFTVLSDKYVIDYDRNYMKEIVSSLKQLDEIGYQNLNEKQLKRLKKIHRQLEWYASFLISKLLDYLEENNITDIVIEDLLLSGKLGINEEFDVKYSRLSKLLHLSNVKNKLLTQAEKRGIRAHITPSYYTSQTCPNCGCISKDNRKTQEEFKCIKCNYEINADLNASVNMKIRFISDVLRKALHNTDEYGRLIPKMFGKYEIQNILMRYYESQEVWHHPVFTPEPLNSTKLIKNVNVI